MSTSWPGGIISKTSIVPTGPSETGTASGIWTMDQAAAYTKQGIWPLAGNAGSIDLLFSAYTYTGNGSTQTITNGIDLAGKGGLVWIKTRAIGNHVLYDSIRTGQYDLRTVTTGGNNDFGSVLTQFDSTGFSFTQAWANVNSAAVKYAAWSFAQGPKFFKMAQVVVSGSNQTVDLSSLGTVGMVTVKRTDSTSDWYTWHRSLTAGNLVYLNTTAAQAASAAISVSGTTLTLTQATIGDGTYIVYAWAHDADAATGMIQCGTYVGNGSSTPWKAATLGWEPQFLLGRGASIPYVWTLEDSMRRIGVGGSTDTSLQLYPNSSGAEVLDNGLNIYSDGFGPNGSGLNQAGVTYIYLAIRRPMKVPTLGTQVYNAIARTGTGAVATVTGVGFAPDLVWSKGRSSTFASPTMFDRLRGPLKFLGSADMASESTNSSTLTSFDMDGFSVANDTIGTINLTGTYINWAFRRAPKVFDQVCYTGTGVAKTEAHNLGVVPELIIVKQRSAATYDWLTYNKTITATKYLGLNSGSLAAPNTDTWNNTEPTNSMFTVGLYNSVSSVAYVAYLFATLAGISKVGSYTGNGSSLTINAGFTTGARFILIKRTDSTGDWFTWDSTRGIVAGNDPHLSLNTTAAEVTTDDSIDPDNSGFIVNQVAATNVNVTSATYIYLAFA